MIDFFAKLKDNRIFQFSVVVIIILNAILIGATTYQLDPIFLNTIHLLDYAITIFFVIEINKLSFFHAYVVLFMNHSDTRIISNMLQLTYQSLLTTLLALMKMKENSL